MRFEPQTLSFWCKIIYCQLLRNKSVEGQRKSSVRNSEDVLNPISLKHCSALTKNNGCIPTVSNSCLLSDLKPVFEDFFPAPKILTLL